MHCEVPVLRRCCFCLPLRRGVLAFCYLNIVICVIELWLTIASSGYMQLHRIFLEVLPIELNLTLTVLDAVASIVLIIGLHMKHLLLVKIYYYFMFFSISSSVPLIIINEALSGPYKNFSAAIMTYFFFSTVINLYLLLLVRSLMRKFQVSSEHTFGNRLAEFVEGPSGPGPITITIRDDNNDAKTAPQ